MALWALEVTTILLLAFSLTSPFIASFSGSSSGGGIESGRVYLIAPELADCPVYTNCATLSSYSTMATSGVCDVIFSFLPGIHQLSQTWAISASSNVTIRGAGDSAEGDNEPAYVVDVTCKTNFSGSHAIRVSNSRQIVFEGIRVAHCDSSLYLETSNGTTVRNVNIVCSSVIPTDRAGLSASNCGDIAIKHSIFTNCSYAIDLEDVQCGIIDDIVSIGNNYGLHLTGFLELEVSKSYFMNNHLSNIFGTISQGIITFKKVLSQGSNLPLFVHVVAATALDIEEATPIKINIFDSTVRMEEGSQAGIYLYPGIYNVDINLQSVSVTGTSASGHNGIIIVYFRDLGSLAQTASVRIDNVTIENINTDLSVHAALFSPAALLILSITNLTISDSTIKNNGVTGIYLYDSTAVLQGNITLTNNSGINGGGISLISNSFIVLDSSTNLKLSDNSAEKFGGGIYVSRDLLWLTFANGDVTPFTYCIALSVDGSLKPVVFEGNRANVSGHDLYGGYDFCILGSFNNQFVNRAFFLFGDQRSGNCNQTIVSSDPIKLLPCNEYCVDDSENSSKQYMSALFPGQDFSLRIAAVGRQNGLTPAIVLFSSNDIILDKTSPDTTQSIDAQCTPVTLTLALREYVDEAVVYMTIADERLPMSVNTPIEIYVGVLPCPAGFNLSGSICACTNSIQNLATCNITSESIQKIGSSWIYPRNDSIMIFENCPLDYCNSRAFTSDNPDEQCDHNRSGILCGECIPGYSLILGSNECRNCTEKDWQLPVIVLGSVLAGIGLVILLIAINLTVSVGTVNGLVFFANIVKIYEPIFVSNSFHPVLLHFVSWLNLDLGITSCFIAGMTACVKVGLQFIFPLYLLSIFVFIIVICKMGQWPVLSSSRFIRLVSGKVTVLIGSKAVPVLATVLLLSYTKLLRTTILIFHKATILTTDCDKNTSVSTCENYVVWYVDGNKNYASTNCHGFLFGVALGIFSPLVVLFTSFLLFFPLMERYLPRFICWSSWHMRLKPWYDAYGGPYKDEYRSWTGMLLLVRCMLALVAAFENNLTVNISVLAWTCLSLISLLSFIQVYKTFLLNSLEMMYLACLLLMVFLSTSNDGQSDVVLSVVLCSLLLITVFNIYRQLVKLKRIQLLLYKAKKKMKNFRSKKAENENIDHSCEVKERQHSTTLIRLDSAQFNECREPVLEQDL